MTADRVVGVDVWRPMDSAPRDGSLLRLLVQFTEHSTEDTSDPCPTIGSNSFDHTEDDEWKFAGWSWQQDCYTQGEGIPVGWLPMLDVTTKRETFAVAAMQGMLAHYGDGWDDNCIRGCVSAADSLSTALANARGAKS